MLVLFPICGALRLARFNISDFKNVYTGIPITVAGSLVALDNILSFTAGVHTWITVIIVVTLSYLMVSPIQIKKF